MTKDDQPTSIDFKFSGFLTPNYTQIPDQLFDELLPILSGNEVKVLLYIARRTFGFKRATDNISLSQMVSGITTKDGTQLDGGTGLSKASVARALKDLEDKNIVLRERRWSDKTGDLPTTYRLNVLNVRPVNSRQQEGSDTFEPPRVSHRDTPLSHPATPRVSHRDTQETGRQKTEATTGAILQNQSTDKVGDKRVVARLISLGISQNVSQTLAVRFSPEYINQKIEYLEYLCASIKNSVKKPAAWLRRAIEDDFNAPDGFVNTTERERRANEEIERKRAILEAQKAQAELIEQQQNEFERQLLERLQRLYQKHGTTDREITLWSSVQKTLIDSGVSVNLVTNMHLLTIGESEAIVHVYNQFLLRQIAHSQITQAIEATLASLVQRPIKVKFIVDQAEGETTETE